MQMEALEKRQVTSFSHFTIPLSSLLTLILIFFFFLLFYCFEKDSWHVTRLITNPPCSCSKLPLHCWAARGGPPACAGLSLWFLCMFQIHMCMEYLTYRSSPPICGVSLTFSTFPAIQGFYISTVLFLQQVQF